MKREVYYTLILFVWIVILSSACKQNSQSVEENTYGNDKEFLRKSKIGYHELKDDMTGAALIVVPEWQGRVMTSSSSGDDVPGYGWINYKLIASGEKSEQFNPFGGEERFWLGPEGGPFSLYFDQGDKQVFENWNVPAFIDTEAYPVLKQTGNEIVFEKDANLKNAAGYTFDLRIKRTVKLLKQKSIIESLELKTIEGLESVAYFTENKLINIGDQAWQKDSGLISIWLLSMFAPSPSTTVFIPFMETSDTEIPVVNDEYFGKVPTERLIIKDRVIYFKIDGKYRSKIGVPKGRAGSICGSYDSSANVLTILKINTPDSDSPYLNGIWGEQDNPFNGDVLNSYNDGPVEDGSIMGPFYELESSSPGAELKPGESIVHKQYIYHFRGDESELEKIVSSLFGLSLTEIKSVF